MAKTQVVHCKRDSYDVYIGRGSQWGNPFTHITDRPTQAAEVVGSREEAIARYMDYLAEQPDLLAQIPSLRGKRLGCWCSPKACHGDLLAQLAEGIDIDELELPEFRSQQIGFGL